jgi:adenosine kinase
MSKTRLVVCGSIAIDRIMKFSGNYHDLIDAAKIDVLSLSVLVDSLTVVEGGIGANIAYNLVLLGSEVSLIGSVGPDGFDYLQRLSELGIDTQGVHMSRLLSGSFNVLTDSVGNQIGGFYPGAMSDAADLSFLPWVNSGEDIIACISAHDPVAMRRQTEECQQHKIRFVYDPGQQVSTIAAEDLRLGIEAAEVVIVNEYELSMLCTRTGISEAQLQSKVPVLITTHGEQGSRIFDKQLSAPLEISIAKPEEYVDPTGAGDAYRAGFLYGYLRQWDLKQCGRLGSVIASFTLEHHGPQAPFSREDITKRYQQTFNEEVTL